MGRNYGTVKPPKPEKEEAKFLKVPRYMSVNTMMGMYFLWLFVVVFVILVLIAFFFPEKYEYPWANFYGK